MDKIINKIKNYEHKVDLVFKHSAVLIPIIEIEGKLQLLYEVRALHLKHQPGDVCFPGGRIEENETPLECAIRETVEELNIKEEHIEVFGEIDTLVTSFNTVIHVFVGRINGINIEDIDYSLDEVHEIFAVDLEFLKKHPKEVYELKNVVHIPDQFPIDKIYNGEKYDWRRKNSMIHVFHLDDYFIWGVTAKMTRNLLDILNDETSGTLDDYEIDED